MEKPELSKYAVILATNNPSDTILDKVNHSIQLLLAQDLKVYLIASGNKQTMKKIAVILRYHSIFLKLGKLSYNSVLNKGIPQKWNLGIERAIYEGADILSLLTDDSSPNSSYNTSEIIEYFTNNCKVTDLMSLPSNLSSLISDHKRIFISDIGMTFHRKLYEKLRFDEELVHSFTDYKFSFTVVTKLGGNIVIYPKRVIDVSEPITESNEVVYLPEWTLYLVFRNSIYWAFSEKQIKYKLLILGLFYFLSFPKWLYRSFRARRSIKQVTRAIIVGTLDGLLGNTGITTNLHVISDGRFRI